MKTTYTEKQVKIMMEEERMTRKQAIAELEEMCRLNDLEQIHNYGEVLSDRL